MFQIIGNGIKYGLLLIIILLAVIFWFIERMIRGISHYPPAVMGTNPMGQE